MKHSFVGKRLTKGREYHAAFPSVIEIINQIKKVTAFPLQAYEAQKVLGG
jgi:hypothetical protein